MYYVILYVGMKIQRLQLKAAQLRRQGYSFREIHEQLGVAKSTASLWLRSVPLSLKAKKRLVRVGVRGRAKGWAALKVKRAKADKEILEQSRTSFAAITFNPNTAQLLVALLYWAEGAKKSPGIYFTNSDPVMIKTFMELIRQGFALNEANWRATLHLHEYHDEQKQKEFWSKVTGIPIGKIGVYHKPHTGVNKHPGYPGCIQIRYPGTHLFKYIRNMYNSLAHEYGGLVYRAHQRLQNV